MSDHDDSPFDDDDYKQLANEMNEGELSPEDVFSMVMMNKVRMTKIHVELHDSDGNILALHEVVEDLLKYIDRKLADHSDENQFGNQIYPLMTKMMTSGLARILGIYATGFFLANESTRYAFVNMMSLSFLLLKYIQQKGITIHTREEKVTQEEIDQLQEKSRKNSEEVLSSMVMGSSPTDIIKKMLDNGNLSADELKELLDESEKSN